MNVLILIILEYIYIFQRITKAGGCHCLNPYYTGIHLHLTCLGSQTRNSSLNPYYTGIHLHI